MLDLAISIGIDSRGTTVIETNHEVVLNAPEWPRDCDFQLVAFNPSGRICEVVRTDDLARDIVSALITLDKAAVFKRRKPDWYRNLKRYAKRAS